MLVEIPLFYTTPVVVNGLNWLGDISMMGDAIRLLILICCILVCKFNADSNDMNLYERLGVKKTGSSYRLKFASLS